MKPLALPLFADENIHPDVVAGLRARGKDVRTVEEVGLRGADDRSLLQHAGNSGRVVLTHDADFGRLAVQAGERYLGILFVRPGHISSEFVLGALDALDASSIEVSMPFIVVVERRDDQVRVRVRAAP